MTIQRIELDQCTITIFTDLDSVDIDIGDVAAKNGPLSNAMKWKLIKTRKPDAAVDMPSQVLRDKTCKEDERMRYCNRSWFDAFPFTAFSLSKKNILLGLHSVSCFSDN